MWFSYVGDVTTEVPARYLLPAVPERAGGLLFRDLFARGEDFGVDHNWPGTAGDFLFYLGAGDFV